MNGPISGDPYPIFNSDGMLRDMMIEEQIAAKLDVLIEGIADHKMDAYGRRNLGVEIVRDIVSVLNVQMAWCLAELAWKYETHTHMSGRGSIAAVRSETPKTPSEVWDENLSAHDGWSLKQFVALYGDRP